MGTAGATVPGLFTVNKDGKQVQFATANMTNAGTHNLFQWSTANSYATPDANGWYVLSHEEWTYLLVTRDVGEGMSKNALGTVNGKKGLIILPDGWVQTASLPTFTPVTSGIAYDNNDYDTSDWALMEASGAVFLPCEGYSSGGGTPVNPDDHGSYWASDQYSADNGYCVRYSGDNINDQNNGLKTNYYSIRLVREVQILDENDNALTFAAKFGEAKKKDFALMNRTLYKDGYFNTLCLPFDVNSIAASPLAGAEIFAFQGGNVVGTGSDTELQLRMAAVTGDILYKGVPYLIRWTSGENLSFLKFDNITWGTGSDAGQTGDESVTFHGFYPVTQIEEENHYNLFLGADDVLYWPIADGTSMRGFRAYWLVANTNSQSSPMRIYRGMPASLYIPQRTSITTGMDEEEVRVTSEKQFREGRVVLLINGETYSIGGQKL